MYCDFRFGAPHTIQGDCPGLNRDTWADSPPAAPSGLLAPALSISAGVSKLGRVGIGVRNVQLYCGRADIDVSGDTVITMLEDKYVV